MPARELIESLVSLNLSHKRSFALEIKLDAVGLASKYMKLFTAAVAWASDRHEGYGQAVVVVVVLEDSVELLEYELVDVTEGDAVKYVFELWEDVDEFTEVTFKPVRELLDLVEEVDVVVLLLVVVIP
jgi:hypothetical protein